MNSTCSLISYKRRRCRRPRPRPRPHPHPRLCVSSRHRLCCSAPPPPATPPETPPPLARRGAATSPSVPTAAELSVPSTQAPLCSPSPLLPHTTSSSPSLEGRRRNRGAAGSGPPETSIATRRAAVRGWGARGTPTAPRNATSSSPRAPRAFAPRRRASRLRALRFSNPSRTRARARPARKPRPTRPAAPRGAERSRSTGARRTETRGGVDVPPPSRTRMRRTSW